MGQALVRDEAGAKEEEEAAGLMPNRPLHPCTSPSRCPTLVAAGQRLCVQHQRQVNYEYNQQRPARHQFYQTPEWRRLSKQVLTEQPWCACGAKATQADHIISIKDRPDLALDRGNLVGRCGPCHSRKTALEDGRWQGKQASSSI